jgi:hypothetical protein
MTWVPASERAKTVHAFDRAATVVGFYLRIKGENSSNYQCRCGNQRLLHWPDFDTMIRTFERYYSKIFDQKTHFNGLSIACYSEYSCSSSRTHGEHTATHPIDHILSLCLSVSLSPYSFTKLSFLSASLEENQITEYIKTVQVRWLDQWISYAETFKAERRSYNKGGNSLHAFCGSACVTGHIFQG